MAIQMRRGLKANLDPSKVVAGEIVMATDLSEDYIAIAKSPSNLVQLATKDMVDNAGIPTVVGKKLIFGNVSQP